MGARLATRWRLALALLLPCLGGLAYLAAFGAPGRLIAINAGALALGLAWIIFGQVPKRDAIRLGLAVAATGLLFIPLLTGPDLGGVARWLPAGPVMLHSGPLFLPLLVVLAASETRFGAALLALATAALALQPDAAALAALALASVVLAAMNRSIAFALVAAAAATLAVLTFGAGDLAPQLFTEGVLAHVATRSMAMSVILGLLLVVEPIRQLAVPADAARPHSDALTALLVGFSAMAILGPFPFPLIGYGASPILGFALALGVLAGDARTRGGFRESP